MPRESRVVLSRRFAAVATFAGSVATVSILTLEALLVVPIVLSDAGAELYGAWLASGAVVAWMHAFDLGIPNLMIQRIAAATAADHEESAMQWFVGGLALLGSLAVGLLLLVWFGRRGLVSLLGISGSDAVLLEDLLLMAGFAAALSLVSHAVLGLGRAVQRTAFLASISVFASVVGLVVALVLALRGYGVTAIALGLLIRSVTTAAGNIAFGVVAVNSHLQGSFRTTPRIVREFLRSAPATTLAGISYSLTTNADVALAGYLISPAAAVVMEVTRKMAQIGRGIIDMIPFSAYGGFAHLIGEPRSRSRSPAVLRELTNLRTAAAIGFAATYFAVADSLVSIWVGPVFFGGVGLVTALGLRLIVSGGAFLWNYLYRAMGPVVRGSLISAIESAGLVLLAPVGVAILDQGLVAIAWAGLLAAVPVGVITATSIVRLDRSMKSVFFPGNRRTWLARTVVLVSGVGVGQLVQADSWFSLALLLIGVSTIVLTLLLASDRQLRQSASTLLRNRT